MTTNFARMRVFGLVLGASAALMSCRSEPNPSSEDSADEVWNNEDFSTATQGLYKGQPGAVNGDWNYCDGATLCVGGEGDCDSNTECTGGAVCGKDNGAAFGMPKDYDVCVAPHCLNHAQDADETGADCGGADCGTCNGGASCTGSNGDLNFCSIGCQCGQGQGDCDYDSDCQAGLICKRKVGGSFGLSADTDVCMAAHCRNAKKDADETGRDCGGADCQACPVVVPVFVGSFNINQGPSWTTDPPVLSCVEACAQLFGAGTYHCSTVPGVLNNQSFVDGWADSQFCATPVAENFKKIDPVHGPGYNCGAQGCSYSAYVMDHSCTSTNYCWK